MYCRQSSTARIPRSSYFEQKDKTVGFLAKFLGIDRSDAEYAYQAYLKWVDRVPRPKIEGIRSTIDAIKKTTPKAAAADPASFIDTSVINQLVKEGYFSNDRKGLATCFGTGDLLSGRHAPRWASASR